MARISTVGSPSTGPRAVGTSRTASCLYGQGSGWLSTDKEYDNFELDLEFRVPAGGDSGVFIHRPHKGNPAFEGMEIQVLDDYDARYANLKPTQYCGSLLYDVSPATPHVSKKAGEWQKMHIICQDNHVKVSLNGTQVVDADLSAHPDKLPTHPGLKRTSGYIGLQESRLAPRTTRTSAFARSLIASRRVIPGLGFKSAAHSGR